MRSEPRWLTSEHLIEVNKLVVASTGEPFGVLKPHELESATHRPYSLWAYGESDNVAALAVRLMLGIAQDHPFQQGNKRTGFIAAAIFLDENGWLLNIEDFEDVADTIAAAVTDESLEQQLVELFETNLIQTA